MSDPATPFPKRAKPLARREAAEENRRVSRYDVRVAIVVELADGTAFDATCRNLGVGGMFIETTRPARFESSIRIRIPLPGLAEPARLTAIVRWVDRDGMGVQFGVMGARDTHGLLALMRG